MVLIKSPSVYSKSVGATAKTTTGVQFQVKEPSMVKPIPSQSDGKGKGRLPQTGEKDTSLLGIAGIGIVAITIYWQLERKTKRYLLLSN